MKKLAIVAIALLAPLAAHAQAVAGPAAPAPAAPVTPTAQAPVALKGQDLEKAAGLARLKAETDKALTGVDGATRIGIIVETGKPGPAGQGTLVILPTDPNWAALVAVIKSVGAARAADTASQLTGMGIAVQPDAVDAPAAPAAPAAPVTVPHAGPVGP